MLYFLYISIYSVQNLQFCNLASNSTRNAESFAKSFASNCKK